METKKLLPGQSTMAEALAAAIETSAKGYAETHEEIEAARKADWKTPDGKPWRFSWEK